MKIAKYNLLSDGTIPLWVSNGGISITDDTYQLAGFYHDGITIGTGEGAEITSDELHTLLGGTAKETNTILTSAGATDLVTVEYEERRHDAYPSWREQKDMQYHDEVNGTSTWMDAIAAVKTRYPKI